MKRVLFIGLALCLTGMLPAQTVSEEGRIQCRVFENHCKKFIKLSRGSLYNGWRSIQVDFDGNQACRYDSSLDLRTIYCPDEGVVKYVFDQIKTVAILDEACAGDNSSSSKMPYKAQRAEESAMVQGFSCQKWKITFQNSNAAVEVEAWVCEEMEVPEVCKLALMSGLDIPGFTVKYTMDLDTYVPLLGAMSSFVASEVDSFNASASQEMFDIPSDYKELDYASEGMLGSAKLPKLYKANVKALKKAKRYKQVEVDEDLRFDADEEWK